MKKTVYSLLVLGSVFGAFLNQETTLALSDTDEGEAAVNLQKYKEDQSLIRDPENPDIQIDPGESPQTEGDLRIDFVPKLEFSTVKLTEKNKVFPVNAQLFHDQTGARGNFIQVSDYRDNSTGWSLQVRQESQFKHAEKADAQLKGAVISLDQTWTNSKTDATKAPSVSKEVIHMNNVGATYNLATAQPNKGTGTWSVIFGASSDNKNDRPNTLTPRKDQSGKEIQDPIFKKPVYSNRAITLLIPKGTEVETGTYSTVLTWILAELP